MGIKKVKPTSPGRRFQEYSTFEEITRDKPEKGLLKKQKKNRGKECKRAYHKQTPGRGA